MIPTAFVVNHLILRMVDRNPKNGRVLSENPHLKKIFSGMEHCYDAPLSISHNRVKPLEIACMMVVVMQRYDYHCAGME
jgi:hypothetical protein